MAERELFQIGEVAKMYHLSVGTLRHYEQVGLLKPEYTDPATGYRYYSVRQFEQLTNIRYLRALGLPLDEIAATLHDRDVDNIAEALRRQKELIARKKQELEIMERKIDHRLAQLEDARRSELDCIRLVEQPALRLVLLRDSVKFNSYLWLERSIRKIEQDQKLPLSYIGKVGVGISGENLKRQSSGITTLCFWCWKKTMSTKAVWRLCRPAAALRCGSGATTAGHRSTTNSWRSSLRQTACRSPVSPVRSH